METKSTHILVVDDNLENLKMVAGILKDHNYLISLAQSGRNALEQLKELTLPSIILLDIMMPEMDGYEVCAEIKKNVLWKDIPIIFLTAKNQSEDLVKGFELGGVDYILKPFNNNELIVRIKNHIELYQAKNEIKEINRTRDKMYSIIAHDIRSPFAGIIQTLNIINAGYINKTEPEFDQILIELNNRTKCTYSLLENLLEWTKAQSTGIEVKKIIIPLYEIAQEAITLLSNNAELKSIILKLDGNDSILALGDRNMIFTIIRNLISNAIKFTPVSGKILVSIEEDADWSFIKVSDSGVGMNQDTIDGIFIKNEFISSKGTNSEGGTGLGLVLVKDFVKRNGGTIQVDSKEGIGTTMIIKLQKNDVKSKRDWCKKFLNLIYQHKSQAKSEVAVRSSE